MLTRCWSAPSAEWSAKNEALKGVINQFQLEVMQVKERITNERPTVLVVEDDPDIRALFRLTLEVAGYRVIEAENGIDGITAARQYEPDAILMDMSLPFMDGCQCIRRIRQSPRLARVPIIACTAYNRWEWRGKAILAGCTDFLIKPVDSEKLLTMLLRYLS